MAAGVEQIERSLPAGWIRDREAESRARSAPALTPRPTYCFACTKDSHRPAAMLILSQKDGETFYVSNIIPMGRHRLSYGEYNAVLEDFYERVLRPNAEQSGLTKHNLTDADVGLDRWMSSATAEKLRRFSACANKSTGSAHPNDRDRWNDFLLSAHRERSSLDSSTLQRWLVEVEDWQPEVAEQLAIEYGSGRALLAFAEGERRSA
jgi:hypothetical protein